MDGFIIEPCYVSSRALGQTWVRFGELGSHNCRGAALQVNLDGNLIPCDASGANLSLTAGILKYDFIQRPRLSTHLRLFYHE